MTDLLDLIEDDLLDIPPFLKRTRTPGERVPDINRPLYRPNKRFAPPVRRSASKAWSIDDGDKALLRDLGYTLKQIGSMRKSSVARIIGTFIPPHVFYQEKSK